MQIPIGDGAGLFLSESISLATIGVCVFMRLLRWALFLFTGRKEGKRYTGQKSAEERQIKRKKMV